MRTLNSCPACGCAEFSVVVKLDGDNRQRFIDFDTRKYGGAFATWETRVPPIILACSGCGHCWYKNQPDEEELSSMYASGRPLLDHSADDFREPDAHMISEMRRLRSMVGREDKPALLDYGSGFGRWARAAVIAGFKVTAYEPSSSRGSEDKKTAFEIVHDLSQIAGKTFDAVNIEQVLEHVPEPVDILKSIGAYCSENTIVRITVPNILRPPEGKNIWRVWPYDGVRVHSMVPFEHLHGFTPLSLKKVVERAQLRSVSNSALWRFYPVLKLRNILGRIYPRLGQTMFFAQKE
ncbi:MAG: class I SAM-dependent methyltransferase [Alphaproteobacteria bacterium]|nr:class I SAM-dependent methyltransferase [Alphaproteobacteria bacterium]